MTEVLWPAVGSAPVDAEAPRRRRVPRWLVLGVVVALVVVGSGLAAVWYVGSRLTGAATPEAAVRTMLDGLAHKDLLTVGRSLSPAELRPLRQMGDDVAEAVGRAGATADPETVEAAGKATDSFLVTVEGLDTATETLDDGLALVRLTRGTVAVDGDPDVIADGLTASVVDSLTEAGFGADVDTIHDEYARLVRHYLPSSVDLADESAPGGGPLFLVTVREGGRWYVSPLMTLGEYLTRSATVGRGPMPTDAEVAHPKDPIDAAARFTAALEEAPGGNLAPLASVLPLAERRFVAVYGQALVGRALAETGTNDVRLHVTSAGFEVVGRDGGTAQVVPSGVAFEVTDATGTTAVETDGDCLNLEGPSGPQHRCTSDLPLLGSLGLGQLRLTVVQEGDAWYVSPLATLTTTATSFTTNAYLLQSEGKLADPAWWAAQLGVPAAA